MGWLRKDEPRPEYREYRVRVNAGGRIADYIVKSTDKARAVRAAEHVFTRDHPELDGETRTTRARRRP